MADAREITLVLRGRWFGRYGLAFCPSHANFRTPALRLAEGRDGRLLVKCSTGCDWRDVLASIRAMGLDAGGRWTPDPVEVERRRAKEAAERHKAIGIARAIWAGTVPAPETLVERYLRNRAIRVEIPPSIRFAPSCWHPTARRLPAMVAAVTREGEAEPVAVHRCWLADPGRKAEIDPVKAAKGPTGGAAVTLSEGSGPLVVCEGVETGLSLLDELHDHHPRIRAALGAGMAGLVLPDQPGELILAPDNDGPGCETAEKLGLRAELLGWRVSLLPAPEGFNDWNDRAMGRAFA